MAYGCVEKVWSEDEGALCPAVGHYRLFIIITSFDYLFRKGQIAYLYTQPMEMYENIYDLCQNQSVANLSLSLHP